MKEQLLGYIDALIQMSHDRSWDYIQGWQDALLKVRAYLLSLDHTPSTTFTPGSRPSVPNEQYWKEFHFDKGPSDWPPSVPVTNINQ